MPPNGLDLARLKRLSREMRASKVPPVVRLARFGAPVKEKPKTPEFTYVTPFAVGVILRSPDDERTFNIAFTGADEVTCRIVHDPSGAGRIVEQKGGVVHLVIDRAKLSGTARVDLAAFGRNRETGWGAPSYVSFSTVDANAPYYDQALVPQIQVK